MEVREFHLTLKNRVIIALALVALIGLGAVVLTIGMTLLVGAIGVGVIAGGYLAARSKVRRALGRNDPTPVTRPEPGQEVFPETKQPAIRQLRDGE